jgi:hypothetical protein
LFGDVEFKRGHPIASIIILTFGPRAPMLSLLSISDLNVFPVKNVASWTIRKSEVVRYTFVLKCENEEPALNEGAAYNAAVELPDLNTSRSPEVAVEYAESIAFNATSFE